MRARPYNPPTRLYPISLASLGLDRTRADVYSDRCPSPGDFTVLVNGRAREIDPQSGRMANGSRIDRSTELRLVLKSDSTLAAGIDQSVGAAKVPAFLLDKPSFLEVGATFPVFVNEHGVVYTKREYPGANTITVATRIGGTGVNMMMWEVSLVNQARVNPRGGRSVADNWFVQVRDVVADDASSPDSIYFPTAAEMDELELNVAVLMWWMPAGPYGQVITRHRHGSYIELGIHYNGWRRHVYSGQVALPLRPMPGARIRYTSIRADQYGLPEAAGLSFV